ncbi:MAG: NAD(P)H-dependent oxidoreductase [Verrucomicrobiota bacterium]
MQKLEILAIAATNHLDPINKRLLQYIGSLITSQNSNSSVEVIDLIPFELPLYRQDREEEEGIPEKAKEFYSRITQADVVFLSFAEHNGSFTAVYKNLFDWTSRIDQKVYQDKPVILLSASPGPRGGAGVLAAAEMGAPYFGMNVQAKISVPMFQESFDPASGKIINSDIEEKIQATLTTLY